MSDLSKQILRIGYTNYRNEHSVRFIIPGQMWFGSTKWHPEPQWFLKAYDLEKKAERDFAVLDITAILRGERNVES